MSETMQRSLISRIARPVGWFVLGVIVLLIVAVMGFAWYSTTTDFQQRVAKEVVKILEDSTGGRVELGRLNFSLRHLAVEADDLVIHGLEGPGEAPYLSAKRILVRVQIISFLQHSTGTGVASHIGLNLLRVEEPRVHLIIDKDGKTNQPVPKHPSTSKEPLIDTLLDLKAREVELAKGVAQFNDRAIPFDLLAQDLNARVQYLASTDRYGATIDLNNLQTKLGKEPQAESRLHLEAEAGRDAVELKRFNLHTGRASTVDASASLQHFAHPEWKAKAKGTLELSQISVLSGVDGLSKGTVDLDVNGHSCQTTPAQAQKRPRFWQLRRGKTQVKPGVKVLPPDPDCQAGYLLVGSAKVHNASYADDSVRLHDINGGAQLHITPTELLLKTLTGYLPGGGSAEGDLRISNWLGEVPADAPTTSPTVKGATTTADKTSKALGAGGVSTDTRLPAVGRAHAYLTATVSKISLRTIMEVVAPKNYGDLGFDTAISGPVQVEWGGPATEIAESVEVQAQLALSPTGVRRAGALSDIPVRGQIVGHYTGKTEVVRVQKLSLETPQSHLDASGILGVNQGDQLTDMHADLLVRDLSEYDQLMRTLGVSANGKKGVAALPVVLHGEAEFHGTARGALARLDLKGHLEGNQIEVKEGSTDVSIDSVVADAEYSPQAGLAVANSTIKEGSAVLNLSGTAKPRLVQQRRVADYVWDDQTTIDAKMRLTNAQMTDVLRIAGQQENVPVTGTVSVDAHAAGTIKNLMGSGHVSLVNGVAYGEPYESVSSDLAVQGQDIEAKSLLLKLHGMQIEGDGGYDWTSKRVHGHVQGSHLQLAKFQTLRQKNADVNGTVSLVADANGTLTEPGLKASLKLDDATLNGQALGSLSADVHSQGQVLSFTAQSTLVGAKVDLTGQTQLTGTMQTQAKLTLSGLDVGKPLAIFSPGSKLVASSNIGGVITVDGPLKTPKVLHGNATLDNVSVKLQGVDLKAVEPLRVSLSDGVAHIDQLHITGQDTDLHAGGTVQVFGATNPKGGDLHVSANGNVSMTLVHFFDADILSTGKVEFSVVAGGQLQKPALTGKVQFEAVNLAMEGVPNGLTNLNGTLVFNEDRLNVQSLTATTGGGQIKIGGFLTYKNGLFADLNATGDAVRVRLYGLSATANIGLKLQGGPDSLLLSGNVLLTRFGIGPDVDFAAFASTGGVSAPPDPDAASNKIRLDVHLMSSPQLDFQNSYAKLAGTVDLTIRGTAADPSILGRIQITDGSATFAGTKYQLQRGDIYFSNPVRIDPVIDLDATARVENYDITVGLHGTTTSLKPTYRSEPPLSEADVFALLALGRTQEEAQLYQEQQVQQGTDPTTSTLLGGALNATVSNRVQKLFGVGSVKIDPAFVGTLGNSTARITVQQQLSRQITATFATNVNQSAQQLIQVQYNLSNNKSIVVTRDETGVFSVVYKLRELYR